MQKRLLSGSGPSASQIIVDKVNRLQFSSSCKPNQAANNELVLLEVSDFLKTQRRVRAELLCN
ncbi:MAG: hypothetical protein Q8M93_14660 [Polaromonas sp.]|uniref:hypothetical protein n=1 Tax=Polaromonas sp. TaxID=1869339 RepID=UPI00272F623C|nr:hypothetical protein [Polaromonas sp.]MDP2447914.1 hypothetical protein [Polaromonas sp.]MDP3248192.1 hypothetical protein [Polaromonas sp.]MDP3828848.1 hypothetical protein [Polaromonas sp.]